MHVCYVNFKRTSHDVDVCSTSQFQTCSRSCLIPVHMQTFGHATNTKKVNKCKGSGQYSGELPSAKFSPVHASQLQVSYFHSYLDFLTVTEICQIFAFLISEAPSNFIARPYKDKIRLTWSPYGTAGRHDSHLFYRLSGCQTDHDQTRCNPALYTAWRGDQLSYDFYSIDHDSIPDQLSLEVCNQHGECSGRAKLSKPL